MQPKLIDLDELDARIKALGKPTPHQVINLITVMYHELRNPMHYLSASALGLGTAEGLYSGV